MSEQRGPSMRGASTSRQAQVSAPTFRTRPDIISGSLFLQKTFPPLKLIVPGLLPEGAILLAGAPKTGKSRFALALAIAIATGTPALGKIPVRQQDVLYLSLEDGQRRTQERMKTFLGDCPPSLDLAFEWPTVDANCVEAIDEWISKHPNAGLVVVDTLKMIRPPTKGNRPIYEVDYESCAPLAKLAHDAAICILIIHHTRKSRKEDDGDPMEKVSGSTGLTGAVDGTLIFERARQSRDGTVQLMHRDLPDTKFALTTDDDTGIWLLAGEAPEAAGGLDTGRDLVTPEQRRYIDLLRQHGQMRPKAMAVALGKTEDATRQMLRTLARRSLVQSSGGSYWVPEPSLDSANERDLGAGTPDTGAIRAHSHHAAHADHGTHIDHGAHTHHAAHAMSVGTDEGRDQREYVSTPSFMEPPVVHRQRAGSDNGDHQVGKTSADPLATAAAPGSTSGTGSAGVEESVAKTAPPRDPGRRTPTSDIPFKPGSRDPEVLPRHEDCTSQRLDFDTGCRTEVNLEVGPWYGRDEMTLIQLTCGHGGVEEVIDWRADHREPIDDITGVRMALAHHAYMCACHCIRPLWNLFYEHPLDSGSADQAVRAARTVMGKDSHKIRSVFIAHEGPPAPRWVVKPEETFDEREGDWPEGDELDENTGRRRSADMLAPSTAK